MRVLYVTNNSLLRSTTSSLNAILQQLRPRGLEPVMVFQEPGPWQQELQRQGIPCYFDSLELPEKSKPFRSAVHVWRLTRLVKRERIDLIHCNEHDHYPLSGVIARWAGVPAVVTLHWNLEGGSWAQWAFRKPHTPAAVQFLSRRQLDISRPFLPPEVGPERAKLLMSGLFLDDFLARGGSGEEQRRQWGVDDDTIVFGTASALKPRKRLEDFVRIVSAMRKRGVKAVGMVAGGGRFTDPVYLEKVKELIRQEGVEEQIRFLGNLDPVTPFFKAIDVAINTCEMEILSMSLCEGMACCKPTLAYDVGGNLETMPDSWCVAPFGDVEALIEKAAKLATDREFRLQLGAAAERNVRAVFDAPVLAARQLAIYEEILGKRLPAAPRVQKEAELAEARS